MEKSIKRLTEAHKKAISLSCKGGNKTSFKKGFIPHNKGKTVSQETKDKISLSLLGKTGENARKYYKDRSLLKTSDRAQDDTKYKYWMLEVKKRDCWKCKIGDENCKGKLEAHHILPWRDYKELRYNISNGITLCRFHHPRKRSEEKRLSPFFQQLINQESYFGD